MFDEATIKLDSHCYSGKTFTVKTRNNPGQNICVPSATLNGRPLNRAWLSHQKVGGGGTMELVMGPNPNESWGSAPDQLPPRKLPPPR